IAACGSTAAVTTAPPHTATPAAAQTATAQPINADPCQLVTKSDAEALAGLPLQDGQEYGDHPLTCTYNAPVTGPTGQVAISIAGAAMNFYQVEQGLAAKFEPIPNVDADEALFEVGHTNVFLRKGSLWVAIALTRLGDQAQY